MAITLIDSHKNMPSIISLLPFECFSLKFKHLHVMFDDVLLKKVAKLKKTLKRILKRLTSTF